MNANTLLHRQIHPAWLQQDRVTSQAFKPTGKDDGKLSVYDGDQMAPLQAWNHYTDVLRQESVGVRSVLVIECTALTLIAESDPKPFPAHAVIKFDGCASKSQIEKNAKKLCLCAAARGWQYRTEPTA